MPAGQRLRDADEGNSHARNAGRQNRSWVASLQLICDNHPGGGAEACFTLNIAAMPLHVLSSPTTSISNPAATHHFSHQP
jgi:hypothetical protein